MVDNKLEIFIDLMHKRHNKVFTDYKELVNLINDSFYTDYVEQDIWDYYEPVPEQTDKEIHNKSLNINY